MGVLTVAVVLMAIIVLLGLVLILGLVRRIRAHGDRLDHLEARRPRSESLPLDMRIGEFEGTSRDGTAVTANWLLGGESVVAFVTTGCSACKVQIGALRQHAAQQGDAARVLVVVVHVPGQDSEVEELLNALGEGPVVIDELVGGPAQLAFQVDMYPTLYLVGADGRAVATSGNLRDLDSYRLTAPVS